MADDDNTGVSITFKAGTGFDVPWIVLHGKSVADVRTMALELAASDLTEGVARLAKSFQAVYSGTSASAPVSTAQPAVPSTAGTYPAAVAPPPFVENQQALPANWGTEQAVAVAQQQLGATVQQVVPNEVAYCPDHGNAPRQYNAAGINRTTHREYSESYRCQVQGCKPWWKQKDGSWQRQR